MEMALKSDGHAVDGTGVGTTEPSALPAATLSPGWYPDPHLRWRARYWDGRFWTERVAGAGPEPTRPVFGHDALAPPERTFADVAPTLVRLIDAVCTAELAHLRAEVETWRGVAEERGRALTSALNALESLTAHCAQLSREPTERRDDPWRTTRTTSSPRAQSRSPEPSQAHVPETPTAVDAPAARSALASIPDAVRTAALAELHTKTSNQRRWWIRS
jgi:hypothetical protein